MEGRAVPQGRQKEEKEDNDCSVQNLSETSYDFNYVLSACRLVSEEKNQYP